MYIHVVCKIIKDRLAFSHCAPIENFFFILSITASAFCLVFQTIRLPFYARSLCMHSALAFTLLVALWRQCWCGEAGWHRLFNCMWPREWAVEHEVLICIFNLYICSTLEVQTWILWWTMPGTCRFFWGIHADALYYTNRMTGIQLYDQR